jgi:N4-(beta-N-acetylglucosaminyl)-L-asparaginase
VAQAVMNQTDHHLLVGDGAQAFARGLGFTIEPDLNTEHSRRAWLEWKRRSDPKHYLDPDRRASSSRQVLDSLFEDGFLNSRVVHGTINCNGINAKGEIGRVHWPGRGQPVQPLVVPDRREPAAGHAPQGRRAGRAQAGPG